MNFTSKREERLERELLIDRLLRLAPWALFFLISLLPPCYFLWKYFAATDEMALYILLFFVSLPISILSGLAVALIPYLYRKAWRRKLRNRLAADGGVHAGNIDWFVEELSPAERRTLKRLEGQNLLLADAYRDTLASRITASRVVDRAKDELRQVERHLKQRRSLTSSDAESLGQELATDRLRLSKIKSEARVRLAQTRARLQSIEAMASRVTNERDFTTTLRRLEATHEAPPTGLEMTESEHEAFEEALKELEAADQKKSL
ncbi:MAG: hypothetical protein ACRD63_00325 [Pyrinomonadaceae bacterium]